MVISDHLAFILRRTSSPPSPSLDCTSSGFAATMVALEKGLFVVVGSLLFGRDVIFSELEILAGRVTLLFGLISFILYEKFVF
jgi:hypothetical protein